MYANEPSSLEGGDGLTARVGEIRPKTEREKDGFGYGKFLVFVGHKAESIMMWR